MTTLTTRTRAMARLAGATLTLALLAGCGASDDGENTGGRSDDRSSAAIESDTPEPATPADTATEPAAPADSTTEPAPPADTGADEGFGQEPAGGEAPDSDVAVAPALDADLARVGKQMLAFARGQSAEVPTADEVQLYVRGNPVSTIAAEDAGDPAAWEICTNEDGSCSSPLDQVGLQDGPFNVTSEPEVACTDTEAPGELLDTRRVLLEASPSICRSYAALAVYVEDGEVVAVDLRQ